MKKFIMRSIAIAVMLCFTVATLIPTTQANGIPEKIDWARDLKNGGYILYFRHAEATVGQDQPEVIISDCSTQRNLSEQGRRQAAAAGEGLTTGIIPIEIPVQASPYCRTMDTAKLMFGEINVEANPLLTSILSLDAKEVSVREKDQIIQRLTKFLEVPPKQGTNSVIIGHSFPAGTLLGAIPNMGLVVIRPKGQGKGFDIVDKVNLEELTTEFKNSR